MITNPPFSDLSAPIPQKAYWLADSNRFFASIAFNILDPYQYPFRISDYEKRQIARFIDSHRLDHPYHSPFIENTVEKKHALSKLLYMMHSEFRKMFRALGKFHPDGTFDDLMESRNNNLPKPVSDHDNPLLFLAVAKEVVFSSESPSSVAAKYGLSPTNVRIWVSMFLTYGERAFKFRLNPPSPREEKKIIDEYLSGSLNKDALCAKHQIFTINSFNNIRRRVLKSSA